MYELLKKFVLKFFRVPPEPLDPMGDVESLRVFRASHNYFCYRFYLWLIGKVFGWIIFLGLAVAGLVALVFTHNFLLLIGGLVLFIFLLLFGIFQTSVSYVILRLDYEMRWYKVSDRSLRIREGIVFVREMTMTFANIQNLSVSQGPIQRFFGIADLKVETAGGGSFAQSPQGAEADPMFNMHTGFFRGVDNSEEIKELMMERLKKLKNAGLGDDDDADYEEDANVQGQPVPPGFIVALRELRDETRALRLTAERG